MPYRQYPGPGPLLFGYDPDRDLPADHLARLIDRIVEATIVPPRKASKVGQPQFDPRLCIKVLVYAYSTGVRSSRQMEQLCSESLPYLLLTRGDTPSYRTLCTVRVTQADSLVRVWAGLFLVAASVGITRLGRLALDSTKLRANASAESVVKQEEYDAVVAELARILAEAEDVDQREEVEGRSGSTQTGKPVETGQMLDILRHVRKLEAESRRRVEQADTAQDTALPQADSQPTVLTCRMRGRVEEAKRAIEGAKEQGLKHVSVTDPDARMMGEGREKRVRECHSLEVAMDNGLIVAGQSTQTGNDNGRLLPLVAAASENEPDGITAVTADSGYYGGDAVASLIASGVDTCIPDPMTAADVRRQVVPGTTLGSTRGSVPLTYDPEADVFRCPEGNTLAFGQRRRVCGQMVRVYRAERECQGCPRASHCLSQANAKRRTHSVGDHYAILEPARQAFAQREHIDRYHHRGPEAETPFGFLRGTLGYMRWLLRGADRVACEAKLMVLAYQTRKIHGRWRMQHA